MTELVDVLITKNLLHSENLSRGMHANKLVPSLRL